MCSIKNFIMNAKSRRHKIYILLGEDFADTENNKKIKFIT